MPDSDAIPHDLMYRAVLPEAIRKAYLQRVDDEKTIERWIVGGMVGQLVRRGDAPLAIEPCDPSENGRLAIIEYPE